MLLADDSAGSRHASFNYAVSQLAEIPGVAELFHPPSTARGPSPIEVEDPNTSVAPKGKGKAKAMPAHRPTVPMLTPAAPKKRQASKPGPPPIPFATRRRLENGHLIEAQARRSPEEQGPSHFG